MTLPANGPLCMNGWTLYAHPLFLAQLESLMGQVALLRQQDPAGFSRKNASKRLAAIA